MSKAKVLFLDVETSPMLAHVWQRYFQHGGQVVSVEKEWELLSFAMKWHGKSSTLCFSRRRWSEEQLLRMASFQINRADVVVAHNGDEFDLKKIRARMAFYGMNPLKQLSTVDTKKVAKRYFAFTSNSLNDLGQYLGCGKKAETGGFGLWKACMADDKKAWKKMETYNMQDVVLLEKVYDKLLPYMERHPHIAKIQGSNGCPKCGSSSCRKEGIRGSAGGLRQQWQCRRCNGWFLTGLKEDLRARAS